MAELADAQDLGSCPERGAGSTPASRTRRHGKDLQQTAVSPFFLAPERRGQRGGQNRLCIEVARMVWRESPRDLRANEKDDVIRGKHFATVAEAVEAALNP